jgi:hypothetical protein
VTRLVKYGIPERMEDEIQMYGRVGRKENSEGLCVTMVEDWVYNIDRGDGDEEFDGGKDREVDGQVVEGSRDPDRFVPVSVNKKRTTKQTRVGHASIACYQCNICHRYYDPVYLGDKSPNGK